MIKSVTEAHEKLYHYTTAAGLKGIIESQQLRATNIAYLNDSEEHTGFFSRRLPYILEKPVRSIAEEKANTKHGQDYLEANGGLEKIVEDEIKNLVDVFRETTLTLDNPYITAFCSESKQSHDDGLLSQWRGYGTDGGYAIVFETDGLQQLLEKEKDRFYYQFSVWADVEYYNQDINPKPVHDETIKWEADIQKAIYEYYRTEKPEVLEALAEPVSALSCTHKHKGFAEEAEVRIVAVPANNELFELAHKLGEKKPRKPIYFDARNGISVPYIMLFGFQSNGNKTQLPISKIIVGPHPDRLKRQKAVQLMLEQHEIEAAVVVSDIPYLGR